MAAAINNTLGTLLVNTYAVPTIPNTTGDDIGSLEVKIAQCAIPVVGTDLAGSQYRFCQVFSSDIITVLKFSSTALTAGAISLGLYNAPNLTTLAAGVAANVHLFATSVSCASAITQQDQRFANLALTTIGQRVWQLLGLTSDPLLTYDVVGTSTTGATAAGTLAVEMVYVR